METLRFILFIVLNYCLVVRFFKKNAIYDGGPWMLVGILMGPGGTFLLVTALLMNKFCPKLADEMTGRR